MKNTLLSLVVAICSTGAVAQEYPLTIEHKFGTTVIEAKPQRVASLDYNGADNLLELGVQPVTIRYWYGDYEKTVWPWASDMLTTQPTILRGELDFEAIAEVKPDVIVAIWSGITAQDYEKLTLIAPTVAVPEGVGDYALPWNELALRAGLAVGEYEKAKEKVAAVEAQMKTVAGRNAHWAGKTSSVAYLWDGLPGAYTAEDLRPQVLSALGFVNAPAIEELSEPGKFATQFSEEELGRVDAEVVIWFAGKGRESVESLALYPTLKSSKEGRAVFSTDLLTGAFSHASLVSLPYAISLLEPAINAALDGDPETNYDLK